MTIKEIIQKSNILLKPHSPTPELDTYLIIEYVTGLNKLDCIMQSELDIPENEIDIILGYIQERINHKPIAYILGYKEFYGRIFCVNQHTLIPRPESEAIIDIIKSQSFDTEPVLWEIGTGSGCIAITLALEIPQAHITASDISSDTLQVAKNNDIIISGKRHPISWICSDLLQEFPSNQPDIIVANLPYLDQNIYTDDSLLYEPDIALYSPDKGLDHYKQLMTSILSRFIVYPRLLIEINPEQVPDISTFIMTTAPYSHIEIYKDIQELDRHLMITLKK